MDLSVTKDTAKVGELILDTVSDHPVDCDIILPDYCPDIARILKTESNVSVDSKNVEAARMTVNGSFCVRILYIPENSSTVRCVTHETSYSHTFDFREGEGRSFTKADARVAFANCRPLGPRRLQVRGSLAIGAKIWSEREENFISGSDDERVELLCRPVKASSCIGSAERPFEVEEELELGYGKPPASSVVKADAVAVVRDYKLISNKVIAKGEVLLKTLYVGGNEGEEGGLEVMEHSIPISQILDLEGVDEESDCEVKLSAGVPKVELKPDGDGENRILAVSLPVTAAARAFRKQEFNAVSDAYSPQYDTQLTTKKIGFENVSEIVRASEMVKQTLELENQQIASITDANANANVSGVRPADGALEFTGDMNLSLLALDPQGSPVSIEKTMPFTVATAVREMPANMRCEPELRVVSTGYSLQGPDRVEMRIECSVEAVIFGVSNENTVVDLQMADQPKTCAPAKTLTLYFADGGEKIWDIAKRYNTSVAQIKKENGLEADSVEGRSMLLIPKKRCPKV